MADLIAIEEADGATVVRIQRPPANALSPELLEAGAGVVERLRELRPPAVVVTGQGDFFSGGIDLKLAPTLSPEQQQGLVGGINRLFFEWY
ncbi:MAG TPA: enoyl-CoA hydratase-related protein, partial [Actinomycetota bacterium]|nr:enoyl-CoA hydratase-related protein [Actinomycetota bacterium]